MTALISGIDQTKDLRLRPLRTCLPATAVDHVLGPAHAPVAILECGDFECRNG